MGNKKYIIVRENISFGVFDQVCGYAFSSLRNASECASLMWADWMKDHNGDDFNDAPVKFVAMTKHEYLSKKKGG